MRVWSRIALVIVVLFSASSLPADHYRAECPLSLVDSTPPGTDFSLAQHGVFKYGSLVFVLRGNILTTYSTNELGNLSIARQDAIGSLAANETDAGVAFSSGFLFVSSSAGVEIYDLRNTRVNGTAPVFVSRTPGYHYRRLAVSGTTLAGLYPSTDLPCYPDGGNACANSVDIFDITSMSAPSRVAVINSTSHGDYRGFNDIAFNYGYLMAVSEETLIAFDLTTPSSPVRYSTATTPGRWLVSNGSDFLAVGNDTSIDVFTVRPGMAPFLYRHKFLTIPGYLTIENINDIRFHRKGWWDETNARLITLIEEVNQMTGRSARTIAFDVFDFSVPQLEGSAERIYEDVTLVEDEENKYDPVAVGPYVYVIGERTGLQSWGACGNFTGEIELESILHLTCSGAEIHGWVTGANKILNVELFLDNTSLGAASVRQLRRWDISATTEVNTWRINVNLDQTARGEYSLRAIATDIFGVRRQFAGKRLFFPGPGQNCTTPRRRGVR